MAIKPILFDKQISTEMVRAILDGRKGATRRIVKGFIPDDAVWGYTAFTPKGYISCRGTFADGYGEKFFKLPCETGDILYVRESYSELSFGYVYRADGENIDHLGNVIKWRPSIHMTKEAARIWLKVTDVRVERLQDMNEIDTAKEGICTDMQIRRLDNPDFIENIGGIELFKDLWNSTIKKTDLDRYGWNANPYVWIIEFERCEKPEDNQN